MSKNTHKEESNKADVTVIPVDINKAMEMIQEHKKNNNKSHRIPKYSQLQKNINAVVSYINDLRVNAEETGDFIKDNDKLKNSPDTIENLPKELIKAIFVPFTEETFLDTQKHSYSHIQKVNATLKSKNIVLQQTSWKYGEYRIRFEK